MTKYQPQPSISTIMSVTVLSFPMPTITNVTDVPAYAKSGDPLSFHVVITNSGGTGDCWYNVADTQGGALWSGHSSIGAGLVSTVTMNCNMPNHDTTFRFRTGYTDSFGYNVQTSSIDKFVELFVLLATALSLGLNVGGNVVPGQTITFSGKLTRTDTSAGLGSQNITVTETNTATSTSRQVGSVPTASDGTYSGTFAANVIGTYNIQSSFAGGAIFAASVSPSRSMSIGVRQILVSYLLPLIAGAAITVIGKKR